MYMDRWMDRWIDSPSRTVGVGRVPQRVAARYTELRSASATRRRRPEPPFGIGGVLQLANAH